MDILKLISLRVDKADLKKAADIGLNFSFYSSSSVLRCAIWVGLKFIDQRNYSKIEELMSREKINNETILLEDVIHAAGK